jgi:phenylalanyl-tRNA synthetase beta chain
VHLVALLSGLAHRRPIEPDRPVDVYDAVDAVRAILDAVEVSDVALVAAEHSGFHRTRSATVTASGVDLGAVGEIAPAVVRAFGLTGPVVAFELDLDAVLAAPRRNRAFVAPSPYPPATLDLAFVVPTTVPAAAIVTTLRDTGGEMLEDVVVFDEFVADALGAGRRSLAFSLRFRSRERTLKDDEVSAMRTGCIEAVERAHDAQLRA